MQKSMSQKVRDLLKFIEHDSILNEISDHNAPCSLKPYVDKSHILHRDFLEGSFWKCLKPFRNISEEEFLDYKFQNKNSISKYEALEGFLKEVTNNTDFINDIKKGLLRSPMNMRISPYLLSIIDWENPYNDPIRKQFIPTNSTYCYNHPQLLLDSLSEKRDSPTPGLVHRYYDKVLFLALDVCPVYCRFCTRSYAIGGDTETVNKENYKPQLKRWHDAFAYLISRSEIEDVVVSGGDAYMLPARHLKYIGDMLLSIPHIRRIRFATKGPSIMPMKILTDLEWTNSLLRLVEKGRKLHKEVCLHTHFNSTKEITNITKIAMDKLFEHGIKVRNQSVLIKGVNDSAEEMIKLIRMLAYINVQPYYVYQHDMVIGTEELRTSLQTTLNIERNVRGSTAGFNTPTFVVDVPGGGGKRDIHSFDYYDRKTGISIYRSPSVNKNKIFLYFDPLHTLPQNVQERWMNASDRKSMILEAVSSAGFKNFER